MHIRLEKIVATKRQRRFYEMRVARTLFGDWCLMRDWGRIGAAGGQGRVDYTSDAPEAERALQRLMRQKMRRGYVVKAG